MARNAQSFNPRQSMSRQDFEIFHYRDPKMQEVPLHHHDFYEIYYFLCGNVEYLVEGRNYVLQPDDILLISPLELHRPMVAPDEAYERIVLWINADYLGQISPDGAVASCFGTGQNLYHCAGSALPALVRQLAREFQSERSGSALYAQGLFLQLLAELTRLTEGQTREMDDTRDVPLVSRVLDYINGNYQKEICLEDLSSRFFVSKFHLSHLFRRSVGTSVYHYVLLKRLQHARQMLYEGRSPGDACQSCGFQDYANFYRSFRRVYGISPQDAAERQ